jgi:hypothetical protein
MAQAGALDPSFDGDGKVILPAPGTTDMARSVVVQPDGRILLGGWSDPGGLDDFLLGQPPAGWHTGPQLRR